jgi:Thioesterase-like superfamily
MPTFSDVSALTPTAADSFDIDISANWTIGGKPNGGYLLALLGRAATQASTHEHVIAASAHFLRAPEPGPVEITVDLLRSGRSASQLRARLEQRGKACVECLLTTADLDPAAEPYWAAGTPDARADPQARASLPRLPAQNPQGVRVELMGLVDIRIDTETSAWSRGEPSGRGELRGWLALPDGEDFDPLSLLYAVDAFPPATFDIAFTGWVPTLELTVYVRALPAPGPVRVLQRAGLIEDQRVDEECWVWDSRGRVVAHGSQLAGIRLG